jgi:diadenylate cyclase
MQISIIIATLDIIIVSILIYYTLIILRTTRALQLIIGIFIFAVILNLASFLSETSEMIVLSWLLKNTVSVLGISLPIILVVIFQPEIRRFLGKLGTRRTFLGNAFNLIETTYIQTESIEKIVKSISFFSKEKIGALIVVERETSLDPYIETGIKINAAISSEILISIFTPDTPLHDGAVIIKGMEIIAARVILPLTENLSISKDFGTRHRAGIGITEETDAISLIVSEKDGKISLSVSGKITINLTPSELREMLIVMCKTRKRNNKNEFEKNYSQ